MRLHTLHLIVATALLLSCAPRRPGSIPPAWARALPEELSLDGELTVRPDAGDTPPLELRFAWRNPEATLGWGAARLWARPRRDHVSVSAIVDVLASGDRWGECREVQLSVAGVRHAVRARPVGRPIPEGGRHYNAVLLELGVHHLRDIADADDADFSLCGDRLRFTRAQRAVIHRFVEWFDHFATPPRRLAPPGHRDVGPCPTLPEEASEGPASMPA